VALTSVHAQELRAELSINENKLKVIGNPIDKEFLDACAENIDDSFVKKLKPFILTVGRLTPAKDFTSLIKAYSLLSVIDDFPKLVIVGDGPEREPIMSLIQHFSLENKVLIVGDQPCPSIWYSNAKGFILSSLWEGYPNALLEAIYFNLPVALTLYDDSIQEIVNDLGLTSVEFAKPGDQKDIARALTVLNAMNRGQKISVGSGAIVNAYEQALMFQIKSYK
jgi:glycosyltransferase involved in cell wall biosynthesis